MMSKLDKGPKPPKMGKTSQKATTKLQRSKNGKIKIK